MILQNEYGISLPLLSDNYNDAQNVKETAKVFAENMPVLITEKLIEPQEKAIILITEYGVATHIGIVAGSGFILHTNSKTGSICQRESHPGLRGRIEGYYSVS